MKRFLLLLISVFMFTSCPLAFLLFGADESEIEQEVQKTDEEDFSKDLPMNESDYIKILGYNENSITLQNVYGKEIFYVNYNPSSNTIPIEYQRYLVDSNNLSLLNSSIVPYDFSDTYSRSVNSKKSETEVIKKFHPEEDYLDLLKGAIDTESSRNSARYSYEKSYSLGDEREIYLDNDVDLTTCIKKDVVLRGIGKLGGDEVCYVWVANDNYTNYDSSEDKVNSDLAQEVADIFVKYYEVLTNVLGDEFDSIITSRGYIGDPLSSASETGEKINIVIYDIGDDYNNYKVNGVAGYFWSKDYFEKSSSYSYDSALKYTNVGKYFYIDSAFCNYNSAIGDYSGTGSVNETVILTLFHEFQHMINFSNKVIKNNLESPIWYNEMLSMLTEDMIQEELNISKYNDVMKTRLPLFNGSYFTSGIDKYLEGDDAAYSYSSIYAFGAFLARNYGGPSFIQSMSKNKSVGWNSIISAIKSNTGEEVTRLQLFEEFIAACSVHSDFAEYAGIKRFYLDSTNNITFNSVTLLNDSIDLWDELYSYQVSETSPVYKGPLILSKDVSCDLPPHTFVIHSAGKAISDTVTLDFSKRKSSKEKIMIIIQDSYSNTL